MAKLKKIIIHAKKLVAALCMAAVMPVSVWSQKPQTGFSDLNQRNLSGKTSRVMPTNHNYSYNIDEDTYDEDHAWTNTGYLNIGCAFDQQLKAAGEDLKTNAKWGAMLQAGNSFMLPKNAIGGIVKFGIDATWFDLSGAQYDNPVADHYQVTAGMGIGASVHVAPFARFDNALSALRFEGYCRFVPSYSALLYKIKDEFISGGDFDADNDIKMHGAFLPVVSCGFAVDYRAIGIGFEYRSGSAKYKDFTDDGAKTKFDMTSSRVYISWRM